LGRCSLRRRASAPPKEWPTMVTDEKVL
jgi:hypothetical protein